MTNITPIPTVIPLWPEGAPLYIYAKGGHGFGMRKQGIPTDAWIEHFGDWLQLQGLMDP